MPKRKVSLAEGAVNERSKRRLARLTAKPAPAKMQSKSKKTTAGNDKSTDKNVLTNEKREANGKQAEMANQETKDLPAEKGETKSKGCPASDEAGEKKQARNSVGLHSGFPAEQPPELHAPSGATLPKSGNPGALEGCQEPGPHHPPPRESLHSGQFGSHWDVLKLHELLPKISFVPPFPPQSNIEQLAIKSYVTLNAKYVKTHKELW
ncbi:PREDICTED: uncharacterized protein LOC102815505 [Chrysochloris asiatica]|uniref:Uncharacterized protein LOC102815505 n=1 Tax=Chrysochloris asiatica TaxID=185453 RepID=A0A9B0TVF3_CHRAS|nr:PREDICTED: uncharacterized protein LOC102815505 [Chrysochloris asiatica]